MRCAGLLSRLAYNHLRSRHIDPLPLLEKSGLNVGAVSALDAPIPVGSQIKFLKLAAESLEDPLLGFRLVCKFDARQLGWLYYVSTSADTLGDALSRLARYSHLNNDGVQLAIERRKGLHVRITYSGIPRHADFYQIGAFSTAVIVLARHITGLSLAPVAVRVAHSLGRNRRELEKMLGCSIVDTAGVDEIQFPADASDAKVVSSDAFLHRLCVDACEEALSRLRRGRPSVISAVENLIAELLPNGKITHNAVAEKLGMSPRSLLRHLAAERSSFSALVGGVRLALAKQYLEANRLSVSETAWLLGYAEVSTFTRAFRRWTGSLPSAARKKRMSGRAARVREAV